MTEDPYKQQGLRRAMCRELQLKKNISDPLVLEAMGSVPRHCFVDTAFVAFAYEDRPLPIGCEQTISQPSTVANQSQLLSLQSGMKVLEIGTGSGYQTAVLCAMGAQVYTIERQMRLYEKAKKQLTDLHYRANCYIGDGYKGIPYKQIAPFDRIIITCGAPYLPQELIAQLCPGGIMVVPVGNQEQEMLRVTKRSEKNDDLLVERFGHCSFVPMLSEVNYHTIR